MIPEDWTKYLGLLSLLLTWLAVLIVLCNNPREFHKSISHHAAKRAKIYRIFALLISMALLFMFGFLVLWLVPALSMAMALTALFTIALLMELMTTWVPLTEGKKFHIHNTLSYGTALLMPIICLGIIFTTPLPSLALIIMCVALAIMLALLGMFFLVPKSLEKYLIYQSIYIAAFQLAIVVLPFLE